MTEYARADELQELREKYVDLHDSPLLVRASEDADEFGGGYTLRLVTNSRTLHPGTVECLAEHGFGVEYLGASDKDNLIEWLLVER